MPSAARPALALLPLIATLAAGCGGYSSMRAQGARLSDVPDPDPTHYRGRDARVVLRGKATYYHDSLAGNYTANGDIYDPRAKTAASRDLPFGSIVRVIRLDTRRSVLVRVNDRGPFGDRRRILDLSRAAAAELDMLKRGVVDIQADVLVLGDNTRRHR